MNTLIILTLLLIVVLGCVSVSNAYATAKQAEAAIEASQTAQLALGGQILISILLVLVVVILLLAILALFFQLAKKKSVTAQFPHDLVNGFAQDDFLALGKPNTPFHFVASLDEDEELLKLPHGWGW
jgi:hypothetical protein